MTPELYQSGPPISIDGINFQPRHPVPLKEEGVFIPAQTHQNLEEEAHLNGYRSEQRVGNIVAHIDSVKEVKQVEPHGTEDRQRIDLVVTMLDGFPIDQVFIQVKSGYGSVAAFFDDIGKELDEEDRKKGMSRDKSDESEEYRRRKDWMRRNRLICINGGMKKRGSATDLYIRSKFMRDLEQIIQAQRHGELVGLESATPQEMSAIA